MPSASYSFLDVAVLDDVRSRFAAGDAIVILSADLEQVLWANGPGAAVFGYPDIDAIIGASDTLPPVARRQIEAASGFPDIARDHALTLRLAAGMASRAVNFLASSIAMPDGEKAILLSVPMTLATSRSAAEIAERAISGFTEDGQFLAFLDAEGHVEAASAGLAALGIAPETLAALAAEAADQPDRIVKRMVATADNSLPAGLARLTDDPARYLLVVIDEGSDGMAAPEQEPETASPAHTAPAQTGKTEAPAPAPAEPQQHDHWYFTGEHGSDRREPLEGAPSAQAEVPQGERDPAPARFVWRTDADGSFSAISPEFAGAVGEPAADVVGRRFRDVAMIFGFDPSGEIAGLLERRDTWSGRTVLWPVTGTALRVPVDLAALPVYDRNRVFEGFRGFGVVRTADAVADPEGIGLVLASGGGGRDANAPAQVTPTSNAPEEPAPEETTANETLAEPSLDPFRGEVPALTIAPKPDRRFSDKVIRLAEHRPPQPAPEKGLSVVERSAFREIGERLKKDGFVEAGPGEAEAPPPPSSDKPAGSLLDLAGREADPEHPSGAEGDDSMAAADFADARDDETLPATGQPEAPALPEETGSAAESRSDEPAPEGPAARQPETDHDVDDEGVVPAAFATAANRDPDTSILAKLPVPLLIHSGDVLHYANEEFLALTGYADLAALEQAGGLGALFAASYPDHETNGADRALRLRTAEGTEFPAEAILRAVPWRDRKALMLVIRRTGQDDAPAAEQPAATTQPDISELKARIAEMRTIIDTATDGVVLIGPDGDIRSISRPAEALFSFDSDEVAGKPFTSLFAIESQRAAQDYLAGLAEHGVASVLNDGREVIGREAQGRFIPLFMTIGRLPNDSGYCAVMRDITQWKRAEEDLTQARALAERASSQKTDFLARISHEIRTPLNAIIGFSELMMDEKFGPVANDRYRDYLRDINRSGNHVLDLVNDLLDISKIEAGQQEMDYEAVSLNDTLAETVAMMQPQANRERVIIRSSFASRLPEVVADLRSIRQVALNILSNAIRYTQAGGQVIVSTAYEASGDVVMRVRDTGVGMTQAEIEQALKPFKQINALKRGRGDGTGLGLPLTKAMVEANRARFTITSTPGEGTLVEIAFPSTRVLAE
ncbi:PAS domain S-box-containing protein [Aquamicrobium terrae]